MVIWYFFENAIGQAVTANCIRCRKIIIDLNNINLENIWLQHDDDIYHFANVINLLLKEKFNAYFKNR